MGRQQSLKEAERVRGMTGCSGREGEQGARRLRPERGLAESEISNSGTLQWMLVQIDTWVVGVAVFAGG